MSCVSSLMAWTLCSQDDAEADSEDFDPDSGEPEPRRPPPGPGPSVRKGRWAKRNMMAAEDSPPPERAKRERSTSVHRWELRLVLVRAGVMAFCPAAQAPEGTDAGIS